jgi:hypothetical protein
MSQRDVLAPPCKTSGMKKHIREMLDDLKTKPGKKDPLPPVVPQDLENQDLSANPEECVRQLDQQAQDDEERETLE